MGDSVQRSMVDRHHQEGLQAQPKADTTAYGRTRREPLTISARREFAGCNRQQVLEVPVPTETLPMEGTTIRDSDSAVAIHPTDYTHSRMVTQERHTFPRVHGRLPSVRREGTTTATSSTDDATASSSSRLDIESREIRITTQQDPAVHRSDLHDSGGVSPSTGRQMAANPTTCCGTDDITGIRKDMATDIGSTDVSPGCDTEGTSDVTTITNVVQPTHITTTIRHSSATREHERTSSVVDSPLQRLTRSLFAAVPSYTPSLRGRIEDRLGSPHGHGDSLRAMVRRGKRPTHQLPGITGSDQGHRWMEGESSRNHDDDRHRQHHGDGAHQQTRGDSLGIVTQPNDETFPINRNIEDKVTGTPHTGNNQRDSRRLIPTRVRVPQSGS